jgi:hypothetical protein
LAGNETEVAVSIVKRAMAGAAAAAASAVLLASPALADQCTNASKPSEAGARGVFGEDDAVLFITQGLENRIEQGLVDPDTGEGFHGLIAFDFTGDGVADASTWIGVGPDGEIPLEAQFRGPACRGLTNIGIYFEQCLGA